jgi:NAD(P)-dependent dehydrogenase (short-subunit alcohol dehydrogenase family)
MNRFRNTYAGPAGRWRKKSLERVTLVTGGNRGIGLEICRQLAGREIRVVLTARNEGYGKEAAAELKKEGLVVFFQPLDAADDVEKKFRRLDILVNNAGVSIDGTARPSESDLETLRTAIETNAYGPFLLCRRFIPLMRKNGYGRIVNVSSRRGALATMEGNKLSYRISKACLNAASRIFADAVKGENILVNCVSPGAVLTRMNQSDRARPIAEGADTAVWLATLPDGGPSGGFFHGREPSPW